MHLCHSNKLLSTPAILTIRPHQLPMPLCSMLCSFEFQFLNRNTIFYLCIGRLRFGVDGWKGGCKEEEEEEEEPIKEKNTPALEGVHRRG